MIIAVGTDAQWKACVSRTRSSMISQRIPRFRRNAGRLAARHRIVDIIARRVIRLTSEEVLEKLTKAGVPCGVVRSVLEALRDVETSPLTGIAPSVPGTVRLPPPKLDEHGDEIRRNGWRAFDALRADLPGGLSHEVQTGYTSRVSAIEQGNLPVDQVDADQEIISRVLAGSKDAFGILIPRYSDPLYRHALGMTGSPDVAEDILQASFIKAYHHLGEVRGRFDAWVFRIVANSCKDWLKNIRRTHLSYDEDDQPSRTRRLKRRWIATSSRRISKTRCSVFHRHFAKHS